MAATHLPGRLQTRAAGCADAWQVAAACGFNLSGSSRLPRTKGMIRPGTSAGLAAARSIYRRASLPDAGDRASLPAHPEYLIPGPEGLAGAALMSRNRTARWPASPPGPGPLARSSWKTRSRTRSVEGAVLPPRSSAASPRSCGRGGRAPGGHRRSSRAGGLPRGRLHRLRRRGNELRRRASHGPYALLRVSPPSGLDTAPHAA